MKLKRSYLILMIVLLLANNIAHAREDYPLTCAKSAILIDGKSGRVLWGKNTQERLPMASTTKLMTALVALENSNISDKVVVPPIAQGVEGSSIYLNEDEQLTMEDLLYGLMLKSGNDASVAIAHAVGMGSVEDFVAIMNTTAIRIGAYNTNFTNTHGLPCDDHYTTAYDLAQIAAYAMKNPKFEEIVSTKYKEIPWDGSPWNRALKNNNKLLWNFEGANGIKTGFTKKAGRCLVSSAKRDGVNLVCVVLNCGPMFEDSSSILEYGFQKYSNYRLVDSTTCIKTIPVEGGASRKVNVCPQVDYELALTDEEYALLDVGIKTPEVLYAPLTKGEVCGKIIISLKGDTIKEISLVLDSDISIDRFQKFWGKISDIWSKVKG